MRVIRMCPHCNAIYKSSTDLEKREYGCTYRLCMNCFKRFWDKDTVEPALYGYKNAHETRKILQSALGITLWLFWSLCAIGFGIYLLVTGDFSGILVIAFGGFISVAIYFGMEDKIKERKNRESILATQRKEYDESKERLKNTEYLTALASFDKLAKKLLQERMNGETEHYAKRP